MYPSGRPLYQGYCELAVLFSDDQAVLDRQPVQIPFWDRKKLACSSNADCVSASVKQARRCEQRACRVGPGVGGGRLHGTACTSTSDCRGLGMNLFTCACPSLCEDPRGGLLNCADTCGGAENMRCKFSATGYSREAYFIPGWDQGTVACKRDADCQSAWIMAGLTCEGSRVYEPAAASNLSWATVYQPVEYATPPCAPA